jgi:hypothetical protein
MTVTRNTDEIVADILDAYGIRKLKIAYEQEHFDKLTAKQIRDQETADEIRGWIEALENLQGDPTLGHWADNEGPARRLQRWAAEGEKIFNEMPKTFRLLLFLGEWAELYDSTDQRAIGRSRRIVSVLRWLAQRCSFILETKAGASKHENIQKRRAAYAARYFTERCGLELAYSNENKPYRVTAGFFYEAMTGFQGVDLRTQCEDIARSPYWDEWRRRFRKQIIGSGHFQMDVGDDEPAGAPFIKGDEPPEARD